MLVGCTDVLRSSLSGWPANDTVIRWPVEVFVRFVSFSSRPPPGQPPPVSSEVKYKSKRDGCTADLADPFVRRRVETHLALLEPLDTAIRRLEKEIEDAADRLFPAERAVLQSTPGPARSCR
jgi:hypothetical protein